MNQLQSHLVPNNLLENLQSGFKSNHSPELALLKVTNDILLETGKGHVMAFMLSDLNLRLEVGEYVGLQGKLLKWF